MKTDFLRALLLAVAAALLAPLTSASAQDIQLASHAEMNDVYARLADLESRLAAVNSGVGCADACGGGNACCDDCCSDCCHAGFIGGAEVMWLKAYQSQAAFNDFNFRDAYRFWAGWQRADGLGVRARYFDYFQTANNGDIVDFETYDIEVFDTIELGCHWTLVAGAGIRYLEYDNNGTGPADAFFGYGPLATIELYRAINDSWQLYGISRFSILVDDSSNAVAGADITASTTELQIGAQYDRILASGALGFARIGWESQWYDDISGGGDASVALQGVALSVGVMR
jgi:hypothetical protein